MLNVYDVRTQIAQFLESRGWESNFAGPNFTNGDRRLEFKMGTSHGEVTVHIRDGRETIETVRVLNESHLQPLFNKITDLTTESDMEAAAAGTL